MLMCLHKVYHPRPPGHVMEYGICIILPDSYNQMISKMRWFLISETSGPKSLGKSWGIYTMKNLVIGITSEFSSSPSLLQPKKNKTERKKKEGKQKNQKKSGSICIFILFLKILKEMEACWTVTGKRKVMQTITSSTKKWLKIKMLNGKQ